MIRPTPVRLFLAAGLILSLSACEGIKNQLGYQKRSPDEFKVFSRAPLSLPPNYGLRVPEPGAPRPQTGTATQQAKRTVFGKDENTQPSVDQTIPADGRSLGERSLLMSAGADKTTPDIRLVVDRETNIINEESEDFIDRLVFWRDPEPLGTVVDPQEEAKRLQENAALGRSTTEGETPIIERRRKALFEDLF